MLPDSVDESSIIVTTDVPDSVEAPVAKGEEVGTATLSYADQVLCTVPLVAAESVAKSELVAGWQQGKELLTSPWFLVILAVVAAPNHRLCDPHRVLPEKAEKAPPGAAAPGSVKQQPPGSVPGGCFGFAQKLAVKKYQPCSRRWV